MATEETTHDAEAVDGWTPEVDMILSALDAAWADPGERRGSRRTPYRVIARLELYSDQNESAPWTVFVRDIDASGLGFITRTQLPLGYGARVSIEAPSGEEVEIASTILRCRACSTGWFEGALTFNRRQNQFKLD
ncbi:MAG TPA: PilZ domain-containing protein [Tepidisphaeraceae bacterium]|nr:PilZ domain-containing protein [Tepidisphaeraceae bacterium]